MRGTFASKALPRASLKTGWDKNNAVHHLQCAPDRRKRLSVFSYLGCIVIGKIRISPMAFLGECERGSLATKALSHNFLPHSETILRAVFPAVICAAGRKREMIDLPPEANRSANLAIGKDGGEPGRILIPVEGT